MKKLSEVEVQKRLTELRNYQRLYPELQKNYETEKEKRKQLERKVVKQAQEIETLKLQIEELRTMIFGKKKKKDDDNDPYIPKPKNNTSVKRKKRSKASFRRRVPLNDEVTQEEYCSIDTCPDCNEPLKNVKEVIRFTEDIVLPALEHLKHVTRKHIETGFCTHCRKQHSAIPLAKQVCSLGENVRARITYCITVLGMTFEKTATDLRDTFSIEVSDGEITHILTEQALKLLPEYHNINASIRGSPAKHCDETSWKVQKEGQGNYAWVKRASNSKDTIFIMGKSRGKGNAQALCDEVGQPTVTDDYGAYDFLGQHQALCWAHPKRKFKDLATSTVLNEKNRKQCLKFYQLFCALLNDVQKVMAAPYQLAKREQAAEEFRTRIMKICAPCMADPKKLAMLKSTFLERKERYLLCVLLPDIPLTNNAAEQALRPLVIKRKISFGSKTQKGADVMSILMSVCFTHWWKNRDLATHIWKEPENFFIIYQQLLQKWAK